MKRLNLCYMVMNSTILIVRSTKNFFNDTQRMLLESRTKNTAIRILLKFIFTRTKLSCKQIIIFRINAQRITIFENEI